jgi:ataxia telangiectasia mutated family protein
VIGQQSTDSEAPHAMDVDDGDGFAPIRTSHTTTQSSETSQQIDSMRAHRSIADSCITFLAIVPVLQSSSGEPTRDKDLTELILNCSENKFLLVGPMYFEKVRQRVLNISLNVLDGFLRKFEQMLKPYAFSRSEKLQLLTTQFLDSTLHIWKQDTVSRSEVGERVRDLCQWLSDTLRRNQIRSWRTRDCVARFMKRYIAEDPEQAIWSMVSDEDCGTVGPEALPAGILPMLGADHDIRVRFRVAYENASLFSVARQTGRDPSQLYTEIKQWLTDDIDEWVLRCAILNFGTHLALLLQLRTNGDSHAFFG